MRAVQRGVQDTGVIEQWRKWGFSIADSTSIVEANKYRDWVAVQKVRRVREFESEMGRKVAAKFPGYMFNADCKIELTDVLVNGGAWWTLGVESYGDVSSAVANKLMPALEWMMGVERERPLLLLEESASFGYPQMLGVKG